LGPTVYTYTAAMRAALAAGLFDRALQVWEDAQAAKCSLDCRLCITYIEVSLCHARCCALYCVVTWLRVMPPSHGSGLQDKAAAWRQGLFHH
jgi:pentatricopeptide repeat protein